ncbi:unnamed protein product [Prunus brigantina]
MGHILLKKKVGMTLWKYISLRMAITLTCGPSSLRKKLRLRTPKRTKEKSLTRIVLLQVHPPVQPPPMQNSNDEFWGRLYSPNTSFCPVPPISVHNSDDKNDEFSVVDYDKSRGVLEKMEEESREKLRIVY